MQGRAAYDARSGSPAVLAGQAMGIISAALPADAPVTARADLAAAQAAVAVYTINLGVSGDSRAVGRAGRRPGDRGPGNPGTPGQPPATGLVKNLPDA